MKIIWFCLLNAIFITPLFAMDQSSFFRSFINDSQTIGAVAESSTHLAEEICKFYPKDNPNPVRILEVGAGTGVFTRQLAKMLRPGDVLEVVELMPDFIKMLVKEFHSNQQIKVFGIDVLTLSNEKPYDFIVSGLPFNSFSPEKVSEILQKYESVSKSGTVISFFEYAALPTLKSLLMPSEDYDLTRTIIKSFVEKYEIEKNTVMINLPPAIVHHLLLCK